MQTVCILSAIHWT